MESFFTDSATLNNTDAELKIESPLGRFSKRVVESQVFSSLRKRPSHYSIFKKRSLTLFNCDPYKTHLEEAHLSLNAASFQDTIDQIVRLLIQWIEVQNDRKNQLAIALQLLESYQHLQEAFEQLQSSFPQEEVFQENAIAKRVADLLHDRDESIANVKELNAQLCQIFLPDFVTAMRFAVLETEISKGNTKQEEEISFALRKGARIIRGLQQIAHQLRKHPQLTKQLRLHGEKKKIYRKSKQWEIMSKEMEQISQAIPIGHIPYQGLFCAETEEELAKMEGTFIPRSFYPSQIIDPQSLPKITEENCIKMDWEQGTAPKQGTCLIILQGELISARWEADTLNEEEKSEKKRHLLDAKRQEPGSWAQTNFVRIQKEQNQEYQDNTQPSRRKLAKALLDRAWGFNTSPRVWLAQLGGRTGCIIENRKGVFIQGSHLTSTWSLVTPPQLWEKEIAQKLSQEPNPQKREKIVENFIPQQVSLLPFWFFCGGENLPDLNLYYDVEAARLFYREESTQRFFISWKEVDLDPSWKDAFFKQLHLLPEPFRNEWVRSFGEKQGIPLRYAQGEVCRLYHPGHQEVCRIELPWRTPSLYQSLSKLQVINSITGDVGCHSEAIQLKFSSSGEVLQVTSSPNATCLGALPVNPTDSLPPDCRDSSTATSLAQTDYLIQFPSIIERKIFQRIQDIQPKDLRRILAPLLPKAYIKATIERREAFLKCYENPETSILSSESSKDLSQWAPLLQQGIFGSYLAREKTLENVAKKNQIPSQIPLPFEIFSESTA